MPPCLPPRHTSPSRSNPPAIHVFISASTYLPWLLLALTMPLMAQPAQPEQNQYQKPDPTAPPKDYRQQVATSIQSLVSGHRPRDPKMSGASTGRLILEGVVENFKIYRMYKEGKAKEAKEEERRKRERGSRRNHGRDSSRERRHGHRSSRHEGGGERQRRRVRHGDAGGAERHRRRHRRHRSGDRDEREHLRRHRSPVCEHRGDRGVGGRGDHEEYDQQQRSRPAQGNTSRWTDGDHLISDALHVTGQVAERLFGPDGTPFGSLPTRSKGVGFLAHGNTVYRHIKAEQDAGQRSKGFLEKHIDVFRQKGKDVKNAANSTIDEEELLIEKNGSSRNGRSRRDGGRRRRHRSRSRGDHRESRGSDHSIFVPDQAGAEPPDVRQCTPALSQVERPVQHSKSAAQQPPVSTPQSRRSSLYDDNKAFAPVLEQQEVIASQSNSTTRRPLTRARSPASPASLSTQRVSAPSVRGASSVREVDAGNAGGDRSASRVPTIRVQSPTPPKQANSIRSPAPSVRWRPSKIHSTERWEPAHPVRSPVPSQYAASPPPMPTPPPVMLTPYPPTPSVVDMPIPVAPPVSPPPPPHPPLALSGVRRPVIPAQDAFLASIQAGVKLRKVSEADKKDASAARKDEAGIGDVPRQTPVYEEIPHSHEVEALEHAQAVNELERMQEEEGAARTTTPFIAPQPRMKMPANFQDELASKLGKMNLNRQKNGGAAEAVPSNPNVIRPRASNETWRTVFSDNERYSEPDQAFRERLGNTLSAGGTPRPPTAATTHSQAPAREETPAPDVFVNLSAKTAGPGWQSGPSWDFGTVPEDESS